MRLYVDEDDPIRLLDATGQEVARGCGITEDWARANAEALAFQSGMLADLVAACEIALESRPRTADARRALVEVLSKVKQYV